MLLGTVNAPVTLSLLASDGRTDLFGQARVYNSSGSLVASVTLSHAAEGLYQAQYTPSVEGYFSTVYQFYFDAGLTIDAGYDLNGETLDVNSFRSNILKIMGLVHANSVVDLQGYDVEGNLTSARIRSYDTAVNATAASAVSPAAYLTGLRTTWTMSAEFLLGQLKKYSVIES